MKNLKKNKKRILSFVFSGLVIYSVCFASTNDIIQKENENVNIISVFSKEATKSFSSNGNYCVIPSGESIGIKMYTKGLLVVGISSVTDCSGKKVYPALDAGIKEGDIILEADGIKLETNEKLSEIINSKNKDVFLLIQRDDKILEKIIKPVSVFGENGYKIGVWVRDSSAGIGTMTFYDPNNNTFASLGHAITDADTQKNLTVSEGDIVGCRISDVKKGKNGIPGELIGSFNNDIKGKIKINNDFGMYGIVSGDIVYKEENLIEVGNRFLIKQGKAEILCDVDGNGVKSYEIMIESVSKSSQTDNKGITIRITDKELLNKTGGIVQGMSGSPVLQNGKIVGAVTHVFVNDPTRGYGIFIENMLAEAEKIK